MTEPVPQTTGRLRWKKRPSMRFDFTRSFELSRGAGFLAVVSEAKGGGWYWYGAGGQNTHDNPVPELATAKRAAQAAVAAWEAKANAES